MRPGSALSSLRPLPISLSCFHPVWHGVAAREMLTGIPLERGPVRRAALLISIHTIKAAYPTGSLINRDRRVATSAPPPHHRSPTPRSKAGEITCGAFFSFFFFFNYDICSVLSPLMVTAVIESMSLFSGPV